MAFSKKRISIIICFLIMCVLMTPTNTDVYGAEVAVKVPKFPHVWRHDDNELKIFWNAVDDVDGYEVFRYYKKSKKYIFIKRLKGQREDEYIDKDLKENTIYSYKVRAYENASNSKRYSKFTYRVSATTYKNGDKRVNSAGINDFRRNIKVGINEKKKIPAKITASDYSNAKNKKPISKSIRIYLAGNTKVLKSNGGYITGNTTGKSRVYIVAHNGNFRRINIDVIDYAYPDKWQNTDEILSKAQEVLDQQKDDMSKIASYFLHNKEAQGTELSLDEKDNLINTENVNLGNMKDTIYKFLYDCPYEMTIWVDTEYVEFTISYKGISGDTIRQHIGFCYYENVPEQSSLFGYVKLADRWYYHYFVPV